ncbi:MAG: hypothetical protein IT433_12545 [Phycisphaerales bacterium]|nr:hypothetical protein [Phycisphaerales bacterium]
MKKYLGLGLLLLGGAIMLTGLALAVSPLIELYRNNLEHPLDEPATPQAQTKPRMMRGVYVGAAGAPLMIAGSIMLKISMIHRLRGGPLRKDT